MNNKYSVVYCDPPWDYKGQKQHNGKGGKDTGGATKHSEKPTAVRDRITEMFPTQKKIELFARNKTEGWDFWGNEVDCDVDLEFE